MQLCKACGLLQAVTFSISESGQHFRQLYCPLPWHDTVFSCPESDALAVKA